MAITTEAQLLEAMTGGQDVQFLKTATHTTIAGIWWTLFDLAGVPAAGVLAGTSTAAGVVPTDATLGCPAIYDFPGTGYVASVDANNSVAVRFRMYDCLFKAGAYSFNSAVTLAAQPSYAARIPGGDYKGTQIWLETVTAFTGLQSIVITYTNQDGIAGQTTGVVATGVAPTLGRLFEMPLAPGDTGVQKIESVTSSVATVGTFNVLVLRRLFSGRILVGDYFVQKGPDKIGLPILFDNSALYCMIAADSTKTGIVELAIRIVSG